MKIVSENINDRWMILIVILVLYVVAIPSDAHAQAFMGGALSYLEGPVFQFLTIIGILGVGAMLMMASVRWQIILGVCAGIYIAANARNLAGLIRS